MSPIKKLLQTKMTRKEFLTTLGLGIVTLCGLSAVLRFLDKDNPWECNPANTYGSGPYGGDGK